MSPREVDDDDAGAAEVDEGDEGLGGVKAEAAVADEADAAVEALEAAIGSSRQVRVMVRICVLRRGCG